MLSTIYLWKDKTGSLSVRPTLELSDIGETSKRWGGGHMGFSNTHVPVTVIVHWLCLYIGSRRCWTERDWCWSMGDGRSSVVKEWKLKSKVPGFAGGGRVRNSFSLLPSQFLCRLVCAWPPYMCMARAQICARMLKISYPSVVKEYRSHSQWYGNTKTLHTGENKMLGSATIAACFPRGKQPNFLYIALWQESYLI